VALLKEEALPVADTTDRAIENQTRLLASEFGKRIVGLIAERFKAQNDLPQLPT
jgi:hypothetical protein